MPFCKFEFQEKCRFANSSSKKNAVLQIRVPRKLPFCKFTRATRAGTMSLRGSAIPKKVPFCKFSSRLRHVKNRAKWRYCNLPLIRLIICAISPCIALFKALIISSFELLFKAALCARKIPRSFSHAIAEI